MTEILNYRRWTGTVSLSGQPTEAQFADLAAQGVTHVINLGPHDNDGALEDEPGCLAALGVGYTYIPVDFEAPSDENYRDFLDAYAQHSGERLHVHCIYNARVSAFVMRFAQEGRGGDPADAAKLMESIWRPGGVWAKFLGDETRAAMPNQYAGYEY